MTFGMCACPRSLAKLGIPSIEPDHQKHPDCPECGESRQIYTLTGLAEALVALGRKRCIHNLVKEFSRDGENENRL